MRLVTKTHDYYDGAVRTSVSDKSFTFVREPRDIFLSDSPCYDSERIHKDKEYSFSFGVVGFCGEIYPFIRVTVTTKYSSPSDETTNYCYDMAEFAKHAAPFKDKDGKRKRRAYYSLRNMSLFEVAEKWFKNKQIPKRFFYGEAFHADDPLIRNIFYDERVAYFASEGREYHYKKKAFKYTAYPILADLQFGKVMDAYQAFQRIEMFLTNELIRPDDPYIEPVPDKIKAESKGFNKFSFRKDKEK